MHNHESRESYHEKQGAQGQEQERDEDEQNSLKNPYCQKLIKEIERKLPKNVQKVNKQGAKEPSMKESDILFFQSLVEQIQRGEKKRSILSYFDNPLEQNEDQVIQSPNSEQDQAILNNYKKKQTLGDFSQDKKKKIKQQIYLLFNDFESSILAILLSALSIIIIMFDVIFLIVETEPNIDLPDDIWVQINLGISSYFFIEYALRTFSYNAFEETFREFISKPFNLIDISALIYSIFEIIIFFLSEIKIDTRVKIFRMLIVLRMIRIFKFSTFNKGVNILVRGLSESFQALSILLFFTLICVMVISSFIYFVEKELTEDSQIQNIPEAIWWAIITITTVGYGDYVPKSFPGKIIGALSLVFGVLLLSLPVAIIGNKFQEIYLQNQNQETQTSREKSKLLYQTTDNQEEKEIYRIILKLNELEEINETIERCLQDNQFLYRSITRDAQNLIDKIELNKTDSKKNKKLNRNEPLTTKERIIQIKEQIDSKRKKKIN